MIALFILACGVVALFAALRTTAELNGSSQPAGVYSGSTCPSGYHPSSQRENAAGTITSGTPCLPDAASPTYDRARGAGLLGHFGVITTFLGIAFLLWRRHPLWYLLAVVPYLYGTWVVFLAGAFTFRDASLFGGNRAYYRPVDPIDDLHGGFVIDVMGLLVGGCVLLGWLVVRGPWKNRRQPAVQAGVRPVD